MGPPRAGEEKPTFITPSATSVQWGQCTQRTDSLGVLHVEASVRIEPVLCHTLRFLSNGVHDLISDSGARSGGSCARRFAGISQYYLWIAVPPSRALARSSPVWPFWPWRISAQFLGLFHFYGTVNVIVPIQYPAVLSTDPAVRGHPTCCPPLSYRSQWQPGSYTLPGPPLCHPNGTRPTPRTHSSRLYIKTPGPSIALFSILKNPLYPHRDYSSAIPQRNTPWQSRKMTSTQKGAGLGIWFCEDDNIDNTATLALDRFYAYGPSPPPRDVPTITIPACKECILLRSRRRGGADGIGPCGCVRSNTPPFLISQLIRGSQVPEHPWKSRGIQAPS